ncbi:MAG: efflux RND transporter permease subunit [Patescibacteria group bacterium]
MSKKQAGGYTQRSIFTPISALVMKNLRLSILVFVGLLVFGLLSYTSLLRREGFPSVAVPISVGGGQYFVDDVNKVDEDITRPLEEVIKSVNGVTDVTTFANNNTFSFVADLDSSTTNVEANDAIEKAINESGRMPENAGFQMIAIDAAKLLGEYDMLVSLMSKDGSDITALEAEADKITTELTALSLVGSSEAESQFTTNPVNPDDRFKSSFARGFDRDDDQFRESVTVGLSGIAGDDFDLFKLDDQIDEYIANYNQSNSNFFIEQTADLTTSVEQDIASLQSNVIMGAVVVTVISALLISWRVSVLTAFFIVAVLLVSVAVLYVIGYTLNTITLFSLVLALGLFVDDATIIAEAIYAKRDKKKKPLQVVKDAISSIGTASFSGTLTTALVFSPLLFITGILGDFIFQMPLTVIISLVVSFVLSITLIPLMANYTLLRSEEEPSDRTGFLSGPLERGVLLLKESPAKGRLLGVAMVLFSVVLIGAGMNLFGRLGSDIFPAGKDGNNLVVTINYDDDTDIPTAERIADEVATGVTSVLGDNLSRGMFGEEQSADETTAAIDIELIPYGDRDITSAEMSENINEYFEDFVGAEVSAQGSAGGPPDVEFPLAAQVKVKGSQEDAVRAAEAIIQFIVDNPQEQPNGDMVTVTKSEIGYTDNIVRLNGEQLIEYRAGFDAEGTTGVIGTFTDAIEAEFTDDKLAEFGLASDDLSFDLGQDSDFAESFAALPIAALGALLVMIVLLSIQFKSLLKPILILLALPFSFFGIGLGLFVTDNPLSFFAMIGIIGLIGIAVNNTILLVDNASHHQKAGKDPVEAMAQALRERVRPLVTTTLTTVAALLPLALTNPFWEALSFTIIFGLASSTLLVLLAFPYYYLAINWVAEKVGRTKGIVSLLVIVGLIILLTQVL